MGSGNKMLQGRTGRNQFDITPDDMAELRKQMLGSAMKSGKYRFTRATGLPGFMSQNRPSTDALNALSSWTAGDPGRSFEVHRDEDESLSATLTFSANDKSAGDDIGLACQNVGIIRDIEV